MPVMDGVGNGTSDGDFRLVREVRLGSSSGGYSGGSSVDELGAAREEVLSHLDSIFKDLNVTRSDGRHCEVSNLPSRRASNTTPRRPSSTSTTAPTPSRRLSNTPTTSGTPRRPSNTTPTSGTSRVSNPTQSTSTASPLHPTSTRRTSTTPGSSTTPRRYSSTPSITGTSSTTPRRPSNTPTATPNRRTSNTSSGTTPNLRPRPSSAIYDDPRPATTTRRPSSGIWESPRRSSMNGGSGVTLVDPDGGSAVFRSPPRGDLFSQSPHGTAYRRGSGLGIGEEGGPRLGYRRDSLEVEALLGRRVSLYDPVISPDEQTTPCTKHPSEPQTTRSLSRLSPARATPPRVSPSRATPPRASPSRATPPRASPSRATPPRASPERTCLTRVNQGVLLTPPNTGDAPLDRLFEYTPDEQSVGKDGGADNSANKPRFLAVTALEDVQAVRCAEFHPSGKFYAVGSNSKTLRICAYPKLSDLREDHTTYQPTVLYKRTKHHKGSIYCLAWSPLGDLIATGSNDKTVKLMRFNADSCSMDGMEVELGMHDGTVRDMCFVEDSSNKSSLLISGGAGDCKIYVTDCATGTPFQALSGHTGHILALHTWGGAMFVSGSQDRTVRFWDLRTRGCVNVITPAATPTKPGAPVASLCVDPSGRLLVTGHEDAVCCLFDVRGSRIIQAFRPHGADVRSIRFSPSAYYLLTAGYDNKLVLTDLQGDLTLPLPSVVVAEHQDKVISGRWHPSDFTFISASADKLCTLWALPPV